MSIRFRRGLRSKTGHRIIAAALVLVAMVAILGQLLGWWPAALKQLRGTAGTEGVYLPQVALAYLTASMANDQVVVSWATEVETYNAGFNLFRAEQGSEAFIQLNTSLIPSQATEAIANASYEFVDSSARENTSYEYRLESVDLQAIPTYQDSTTISVPQNAGPSFEPTNAVFLPLVCR